jgi:glutamine amidotransferase
MCRFLCYRGDAILLETLVAAPAHSLIDQSLHAREGKTATNGDGFGVGWYGERQEPGLYREVHPAWSDENLRSICAQVRSRLFFAHIRAATGTATTRANCHPFSAGRFMFMHNGQVGGWAAVRRRVEALIPDALYNLRQGTTDTEALLLVAMADGLKEDPPAAMARTLGRVHAMMLEAGIDGALRFTAALTDGATIWAFRWASDERPPSLYWREDARGLIVVSEPIDTETTGWHVIPPGHYVVAEPGEPVRVADLRVAVPVAA